MRGQVDGNCKIKIYRGGAETRRTARHRYLLERGSSGSWSWSDSWSIADTWHLMALHLSRVTGVNYWDQLTIADVVQMDWGPSPDSRLDHAMFITSIDAAGEIYLTGHSNDRLDYPLSTVQADSDPATVYYGWHVKDYYPYPFP